VVLVGVLFVNVNVASMFLLPTLMPTVWIPTPTPLPSPPPTLTPMPTLVPTATPTPTDTPMPSATPTSTPTPTPAFTPTPFSLETPVLIAVTPSLSDTTAVPTPVQPIATVAGTVNIVVLGSDRRPDWNEWHTDVVQIVSIQPQVPAVTVISIPRDLYVYIPGYRMSRINFADMYGDLYHYDGGGPALVQQTLLYNLGIPVEHYVRTDFDGFIGIVDALGGIDIPVHCRLVDTWPYPDENGQYLTKTLEAGVQHMDGETALWYARSRITTSIFARERRQQQVLQAIWRKARGLELLPRLPELWEQLHGMIATDMNMADVLPLAQIALQLGEQDVRFRNIGYTEVIPWTTPGGGSVFLPNWEKIEPVLSEALGPVPEGRLWRRLQNVEVWNGTPNAGWDQLAADRLYREGFVAVVGQADRQDYPHTLLIDHTSTAKGSSVTYLQAMFGVTPENVISSPDLNAPAPYRLIIGADYQTCRSP
jgi:LCP family protein required for cell wall assembly